MSSSGSDQDAPGSDEEEEEDFINQVNQILNGNSEELIPAPISPTLPPVNGKRQGEAHGSGSKRKEVLSKEIVVSSDEDGSIVTSKPQLKDPLKTSKEGSSNLNGTQRREQVSNDVIRARPHADGRAHPSRSERCLVRLKLSNHGRTKGRSSSDPSGSGTQLERAETGPVNGKTALDRKKVKNRAPPPFMRQMNELEAGARRYRDLGRKIKHQADDLAKSSITQETYRSNLEAWLKRRVEITFIHQDALLMYAFSFWCEEEALGNRTQVVDNWRSLFGLLRFVSHAWVDIANKCAGNEGLFKEWEVALTMKSFNSLLESTVSFHLADLAQGRLLKNKLTEASEIVKALGPANSQSDAPTPPGGATSVASTTAPTPPASGTAPESSTMNAADTVRVLSELTEQAKRLSNDIATSRQSWEAMTVSIPDPFSKAGKTISPSVLNGGWLRRVSPELWELCEESTYLAGTRRGWKVHEYRDEIPNALCEHWKEKSLLDEARTQSAPAPTVTPAESAETKQIPIIWPLTNQTPLLHLIGCAKGMIEILEEVLS